MENTTSEQSDGLDTGFEVENQGSDELEIDDGPKPWDPEKIRVTTKSFSLRNVLDMIDSEELDLAPDFQRNFVWKSKQKSRLIESLFLQIPLPAFYFSEDPDGMLHVVDGLQRLTTIHSYARNQDYVLKNLEYLDAQEGLKFDKLPAVLQRRLHNAQIVAHIIDAATPSEVKYDIFARINTGGAPLNSMEIRHCMSKDRSRKFLKKCVESPEFVIATGGALNNHIRMQDRETVLRFCAFRLLANLDDYEKHGSLERLLSWTNSSLDDPQMVSDTQLENLFNDFRRGMTNSYLIFGEHAFRKWPTFESRLNPINRPLLESWGVVLADFETDSLEQFKSKISDAARESMTDNYAYIQSLTNSTSLPRNVKLRFREPKRILEELI